MAPSLSEYNSASLVGRSTKAVGSPALIHWVRRLPIAPR
jgi:hypothetical protein